MKKETFMAKTDPQEMRRQSTYGVIAFFTLVCFFLYIQCPGTTSKVHQTVKYSVTPSSEDPVNHAIKPVVKDFIAVRPTDKIDSLIGRNHEKPQIQNVLDQIEFLPRTTVFLRFIKP